MLERGLAENDLVIVDELNLLTDISGADSYPRQYLLDATLTCILAEAGARGKKLLFGANGWPPPSRRSNCSTSR